MQACLVVVILVEPSGLRDVAAELAAGAVQGDVLSTLLGSALPLLVVGLADTGAHDHCPGDVTEITCTTCGFRRSDVLHAASA